MSRQLALRLEQPESESALKRAWSHTRLRMPYDRAIRVPAIAICLRNLAAAETRQKIKARRSLTAKRAPRGATAPTPQPSARS